MEILVTQVIGYVYGTNQFKNLQADAGPAAKAVKKTNSEKQCDHVIRNMIIIWHS